MLWTWRSAPERSISSGFSRRNPLAPVQIHRAYVAIVEIDAA